MIDVRGFEPRAEPMDRQSITLTVSHDIQYPTGNRTRGSCLKAVCTSTPPGLIFDWGIVIIYLYF